MRSKTSYDISSRIATRGIEQNRSKAERFPFVDPNRPARGSPGSFHERERSAPLLIVSCGTFGAPAVPMQMPSLLSRSSAIGGTSYRRWIAHLLLAKRHAWPWNESRECCTPDATVWPRRGQRGSSTLALPIPSCTWISRTAARGSIIHRDLPR